MQKFNAMPCICCRYQEPWRDQPDYGRFLLEGGVIPWADCTVAIGSAGWQRSAGPGATVNVLILTPSTLFLSCQRQELSKGGGPCLQKGATIRLGGMGVDCFTTTVKKDTAPPPQAGAKAGKVTVLLDGFIPMALDAGQSSTHHHIVLLFLSKWRNI